MTCGTRVQPTYGNVASGGGGCMICRRRKQGATKRIRYADDATERLRNAGYEPLEDYPGAEHPWRCRCRCGREVTVRIGNVDNGQRGCRGCAESGFNASKPALLYLLRHERFRALKIGITQLGSTRLGRFEAHGWSVVRTVTFEDGIDAIEVEDAILAWWRCGLELPPYLTPELTPDGGWTETIGIDSVDEAAVVRRLNAEVKALLPLR